MWKCAGPWRRRRHYHSHGCTPWHLSVRRICLSYLKLCKAGVKHKALVNDRPQTYDCIRLYWLFSTELINYNNKDAYKFLIPTLCHVQPNAGMSHNLIVMQTQVQFNDLTSNVSKLLFFQCKESHLTKVVQLEQQIAFCRIINEDECSDAEYHLGLWCSCRSSSSPWWEWYSFDTRVLQALLRPSCQQ